MVGQTVRNSLRVLQSFAEGRGRDSPVRNDLREYPPDGPGGQGDAVLVTLHGRAIPPLYNTSALDQIGYFGDALCIELRPNSRGFWWDFEGAKPTEVRKAKAVFFCESVGCCWACPRLVSWKPQDWPTNTLWNLNETFGHSNDIPRGCNAFASGLNVLHSAVFSRRGEERLARANVN